MFTKKFSLVICFLITLAGITFLNASNDEEVSSPFNYPETPKKEVTLTYGEVQLVDPYVWMEQHTEPESEAWFRAQDAFARKFLGGLEMRQELYDRIKEIDESKAVQIYSFNRRGERYFHLKLKVGEDVPSLYYRDGMESESQLILNPADFAKSDMVHDIDYYTPSPDGKLVAVGISAGGAEMPDLYVIDIKSGEVVSGPIPRARVTPQWLDDSSGLFYTQLREIDPAEDRVSRYKRQRVKLHKLGNTAADDVIVNSFDHGRAPEQSEVSTPLMFQLPETDYYFLYLGQGVDPSISLYITKTEDLLKGDFQWDLVFSQKDKVEDFALSETTIFALSAKNAPRKKILKGELPTFEETGMKEILAESSTVLTSVSALGNQLYVMGMEGGVDRILVSPLKGKSTEFSEIELPLIGRVTPLANDYREDDVYFSLTSWNQAPAYYRYNPADESFIRSELRPLGKFDAPEGIVSKRVLVPSHDGVKVPLTIIHHESVELDGSNPTIVYGYGAYGISQRPFFSPIRTSWFERGGIFTVAHVRGGGEFGSEWHEGGLKATKLNSWLDMNACTEYLIKEGYTQSEHVAAMGGSMGGVLVGRAVTSRPDLYGAIVSNVGNHNPVRNHIRANGPANYPEYGNPLDPEEFPYVLAMDSYFNVRDDVKYPPILLTSGFNDARVDSWMPGKLAAKLQDVDEEGGPFFLRVEFEGGHGGVARSDIWEEVADTYAFLFWALK